MDWLEKDLCIKCNEGGNLLVCSENGCPLAVHEGCMGCPARYDDAGQFHCPYCFYKQSVAESRRAREYVLAKKKALLLFLDEKMLGNRKHIEINIRDGNNGSHSSEASGKKLACIDGISNSNGDAIPDQRMQLDEEQSNDIAEEEKVHVAESEGSAGSKGRNLSPKLHEERSISYEGDEEEEKNQEEKQKPNISNEEEEKNPEEKQKQNISNEDENSYQKKLEGSACCKGRCPSPKLSEGQSITNEDEENQKEKQDISNEEQKRYQEEELSISSEEGQKNREVKHASSSTSSTQVSSAMMNKRLDKNQYKPPTLRSSFKSSSPLKAQKKSNKVIRSSKRLKQSKRSPFKLPIDVFGSPKRRRLMWSDKEEDCLRAGVEMYSKDVINIPWRKILQFGRDVFDETRTPSDLKDKWRNMSKE